MNRDFEGKIVLVTGGSRGIGRAIVSLFAKRGATVVFTYHSDEAAASSTMNALDRKDSHRYYKLDISDPEAVEDFVHNVYKDFSKVDILVNNAGVFIEHKLLDLDYESWQSIWNKTMSTNLTGVANLSYWIGQKMVAAGSGKIINVSSRGAFRGEPNHPAYGASKAGLNAFSQSLAQYLAPHQIIVVVIAPGFVETDMAAEVLNGPEGRQIKNQSPLSRVASPEEIAKVVVLAAEDGIDFMTGSIIDVNGASYLRS